MKKQKAEDRRKIFHYDIEGDIYVEDIEQATNIVLKIANENKECFFLKNINIFR